MALRMTLASIVQDQHFGQDIPLFENDAPLQLEDIDMDTGFDIVFDSDPVNSVPPHPNVSGSRTNRQGKENLDENELLGEDPGYSPYDIDPRGKAFTSASGEESGLEDLKEDDFLHVKTLIEDSDIEDFYYRTSVKLGEGMYGETYEVVAVNNPKLKLAMKVQTKKSFWFTWNPDPQVELQRLYKELLILNRVLPKHENILEIKDMLISPNNVYIVTELCAKLNLDDFYPHADNNSGRRAFRQLAHAIHFMHQYGVVHYDLKADNVLFADSEFQQVKVIDFGVSLYWPGWANKLHNHFDPSKWFAEGDLTEPSPHSHLEDIKGLGKILHLIMCGKYMPLIFNQNYLREMRTTFKPRLTVFDEAAMNLLSMIGPRPFGPAQDEDFPTMHQICQHPWLVGGPLNQIFRNRDTEFALLQNDLTVLQVLLEDWYIMPLTVINEESELANHYELIGNLQRVASNTKLLECRKSGVTQDLDFESLEIVQVGDNETKHVMKVLYRIGDQSTVISAAEAAAQPLKIYNELLITLRILPKHEHIVEILDLIVHREHMLVVRELCGWLTLEDFFAVAINDSARCIFGQLAETVRVMHSHGVVHMDLHCHNVVFTNQEFTNFKIVDFGHARYVPQLALHANEQFQPAKWITPELLHMSLNASAEVDVRALGRILHAMMIGIWEPDPNNIVNLLPPQLEVFDDAASDLLSKIGPPPFGPAAGQRTLTMDEICHHPWFDVEPWPQR